MPDVMLQATQTPMNLIVTRSLRKRYYQFWRAVENTFYRGREYGLAVPSGRLVYMPWFSGTHPEFTRIMAEVQRSGPVTVTPDRCFMLYQFCASALAVRGAVAECGTFTGGTAYLLAAVMDRRRESRDAPLLHLFDTFAGMPDFVQADRDHHRPGDFGNTSLEYVKGRLARFDFLQFHAGVIPDTFGGVSEVGAYAFVHLDVDIYPTMLECCRWFWPRLSPGGAIVFDDYGYRAYKRAARAAIDDYFAASQSRPVVLPTGQAVIYKQT